MAHFAEVIDNKVTRVLYLDNSIVTDADGNESEALGLAHLNQHNPTTGMWVKTSYNNNIRNVYAGVGYDYVSSEDAFYPPKPYPSWVWGTDSEGLKTWLPPIPFPTTSIPGAAMGDPDPITGVRPWNDTALQNPESWDETRQTFVSTNVDSNEVVYIWQTDTLVWQAT